MKIAEQNPKFVEADNKNQGVKMAAIHKVFIDLLKDGRKAQGIQDIYHNDPGCQGRFGVDPEDMKTTLCEKFDLKLGKIDLSR